MTRPTCIHMRPKRPRTRRSIRDIQPINVRHGVVTQEGLVEEVVDHEHLRCCVSPRAVHGAVEALGGEDVEFGFPDVREFYFFVVSEHDHG